jgi:hypothetical protein
MDQAFEYVAWFRNESLDPDDEDHEWPAVFVVISTNADKAKRWGDVLASSYAARVETETFLWSSTEPVTEPHPKLPIVRHGESATDDYIGW